MSQAEHTPEPWYLMTNPIQISDSTEHTNKAAIVHWAGFDAGDKSMKKKLANARRIVACVNACAGIPTEALECQTKKQLTEQLIRQRDMLAEALKRCSEDYDMLLKRIDGSFHITGETAVCLLRESAEQARAALAAVGKGES